jgi:hypothetical protein
MAAATRVAARSCSARHDDGRDALAHAVLRVLGRPDRGQHHDVAGRRVRTLVAWRDAVGPVTLRWDSADDAGRPVARGTFVPRVGAGPAAPRGQLVFLGR